MFVIMICTKWDEIKSDGVYDINPKKTKWIPDEKERLDLTPEEKALSKHYKTLTLEDKRIIKTQLMIEQDGRCLLCGRSEKDLARQLVIDHCHKTDQVRGLLCYGCNSLLGLAQDSKNILENAIDYLDKAEGRPWPPAKPDIIQAQQ